jgi:hypothetical protein
MTSLAVPSRPVYTVDLQTGTKISGTVTLSEKSLVIAPAKSGLTYGLTEANSVSGSLAQFPRVG